MDYCIVVVIALPVLLFLLLPYRYRPGCFVKDNIVSLDFVVLFF